MHHTKRTTSHHITEVCLCVILLRAQSSLLTVHPVYLNIPGRPCYPQRCSYHVIQLSTLTRTKFNFLYKPFRVRVAAEVGCFILFVVYHFLKCLCLSPKICNVFGCIWLICLRCCQCTYAFSVLFNLLIEKSQWVTDWLSVWVQFPLLGWWSKLQHQ